MTNWIIKEVKVRENSRGMQDVVYAVEWELEKSDETGIAKITQTASFPPANEDTFISSSLLTKDIIKGWLDNMYSEAQLNMFNQMLDSKLKNNKTLNLQ